MGQQQLLLLVLSAVIVGLAIVTGINVFTDSAVKANEDAVRQDIIQISNRLQQYYRTPVALGGGGFAFASDLTYPQIGYKYNMDGTDAGTTYSNANGAYTLAVSGSVVTIAGAGSEGGVSITYTLTANATTKKLTLAESTSS